jgi:hypothetical protein
MTALVTVAGTPLPEPSEYRSGTSTLVDSARNVEGKVVGSVVRSDVAKIELKWRYLTAQQWASVLSLFTSNFYNSVRFFDQTTAGYTTRDMYVGDRSAGMWRRHPETGEVMGFTDCALNLIEV